MVRFRALSLRRLWLLAGALVSVWAARLALTFIPLRKVIAFGPRLYRLGFRTARLVRQVPTADAAWSVRVASRTLLGSRVCLVRALALQWMLALMGRQTTLKLGVAKNPKGGLSAHAWLEEGDSIVIGGEEACAFKVLGPLPFTQPPSGSSL